MTSNSHRDEPRATSALGHAAAEQPDAPGTRAPERAPYHPPALEALGTYDALTLQMPVSINPDIYYPDYYYVA